MSVALCRSCGERPGTRPRGMCWKCYAARRCGSAYPSAAAAAYAKAAAANLFFNPERRPGQPLHRCFWCREWRCSEPLRLQAGRRGHAGRRVGGGS